MALAGIWPVSNAGGVNQALCTVWVETWPWSDCQTFVSDNGLTIGEFVDMNPSVDTDCYGWVGGTKYCVMMRTNHPFLFPFKSVDAHASTDAFSQGPPYLDRRDLRSWWHYHLYRLSVRALLRERRPVSARRS